LRENPSGRCARWRDRQHAHKVKPGKIDEGLTPALQIDVVLQNRRPHRARQIVATDGDADGKPAPTVKPQGHIRNQRREAERCAEQTAHSTQGDAKAKDGVGLRGHQQTGR